MLNDGHDSAGPRPQPSRASDTAHGRAGSMMMWACCVAMIAGGGLFLLGRGTFSLDGASLVALLPIALCIGMHFVMHRVMGKSCHGGHEEKQTVPAEARSPARPDGSTR